MNFDKVLSVVTMAGLVGLFVLNADGAERIIKSMASAATSYLQTVQGK